ncbi:MAG TPA: hypothetical protein VGI17_13995 [Solirubrobacterales bacterium]|jgi:hypothetical protein
MTFAGSIILIAVGAILRFATHIHVKGFDLHTIGLILLIVGVIGPAHRHLAVGGLVAPVAAE